MPSPPDLPAVDAEGNHGGRGLVPVDTSVTVLVGRAATGPLFTPVLCPDRMTFDRTFGVENPYGDLSRAARLFFDNAGPQCHVVRLRNRDYPDPEWEQPPTLRDYRDALDAVSIELPRFNLMVLPGDDSLDVATQREVWRLASHFCRENRAVLLVDAPSEWAGLVNVRDTWSDLGIARVREGLALESCAMYYPRVMVKDGDSEVPTGCCGAMAGMMASFDEAHGVWTPAAGVDAVIRGILGLERETTEEDASLFAAEGVNVLRTLPEVGVVSWGARTMAGHTGSWWKFIPVRRTALFIEQTIQRGLAWTSSEPNDALLWQGIQGTVGAFLHDIWGRGALEGERAEDAYFVKCDQTTTTGEQLGRGEVRLMVGFAPMRPGEFMMLEFTSPTARV